MPRTACAAAGAVVFGVTLSQVATMYKDANGFEAKVSSPRQRRLATETSVQTYIILGLQQLLVHTAPSSFAMKACTHRQPVLGLRQADVPPCSCRGSCLW
jgi:hypothetical protein